MFPKPYDIDQLLTDSPVDRAMREPVPDFVETGGDGVSPKSLGSGELGGNMTVQDGYLQSSNYVANTTGWRLTPTGGDFNFAIQADEVHIPDADVTANSFHADVDGDTWWGATQTSFNSNNDNALAYVLKTGVAKFQSIILSGNVAISGIANNTATDIAILDLTHNLVFSVTDADTIAWASGTITLSNGRTFSISSGNTGNMAARTYIYLDTAVSTTVLQTTTTVSTAMGANKKLIAVAQNASGQATFQVYEGIGGLKLNSSQVNISNNNWTYSGTWSVTDADTVAWASGTLKVSDGTSYSITGSNTGNMAAKTYIYFDVAVSSTAFQTTTTATTAIGDGKVLVAVAQNGTGEANYLVMNDKQSNIDAAQIVAGSITANEIAAGAITATKISVSQLSAIAADMGSITAGTIVLSSGGYMRSGQTAYDTGTGWWIGNDGGTPKFSIGSTTKSMKWDGTSFVASNIDIVRSLTAGEDVISGRPVGIGIGGKVARAFRYWEDDATSIPSSMSTILDVFSLTTDKFVVLFWAQGTNPELYSVVATIDTDSFNITFGSKVTHTTLGESSVAGHFSSACKLDTNKYVVLWCEDGENDAEYAICSVSGTTITVQTTGELGTGTWGSTACCFVDTDKFAFLFYQQDSTSNTFHGFCTVSTYTPTIVSSSTTHIGSITDTNPKTISMIKIATDRVFILNEYDGWGAAATTSSSTWTVGSAVFLHSSGTNSSFGSIVSISSDTAWSRVLNRIIYSTVSGTTVSATDYEVLSEDTRAVLVTDGTNVWEFCLSTNSAKSGIYKIEYTASNIVRTLVMNFTPDDGFYGGGDGSRFLIVGPSGDYHVQGMTSNFIGFAYEAGDQDVSMRIQYQGVITLSGLQAGTPYYVTENSSAGTLTITPTSTEAGIALSTTELLIKSY